MKKDPQGNFFPRIIQLLKFNETVHPRWDSFRIIFMYVVFGTVWILSSDQVLALLVDDYETFIQMQTYKGWAYVLASGALFYVILKSRLWTIKRVNQELFDQNENLIIMENQLQGKNVELQKRMLESIQAQQRYQLAVEGSNDAIWDYDAVLKQYFVSDKWAVALGYPSSFQTVKEWLDIIHHEDRERFQSAINSCVRNESQELNIIYRAKTASGEIRWILSKGRTIINDEQKVIRMAGSHTDISLEVEMREELRKMAYQDDLTGLPNRRGFENIMTKMMKQLPDSHHLALLNFDIDDFKHVNELLGHTVGDYLLLALAHGLKTKLPFEFTLGKISGDGFAIGILFDQNNHHHLMQSIEVIFELINQPWKVDEHELSLTISMGVAIYPTNAKDYPTLYRNSDIAMYLAKEKGKNQYQFFTDEIHALRFDRMIMIKELHLAIEQEQFSLHFQPIFDLHLNQPKSVEVLLRWYQPHRGFISPSVFIPMAESIGYIVELERWVIEKAFLKCREWQIAGYKDRVLSINLSSLGLANESMIAYIEQLLLQLNINPQNIQFEVTETALISNMDLAVQHLYRLKQLGISLALDDFGMGYSSLNYLQSLPIDIIKIDRSFTQRINSHHQFEPVLQSVVDLANTLQLQIVAEGIENQTQQDYYLKHNCLLGQGFYLCKPLNETDIDQFLSTYNS